MIRALLESALLFLIPFAAFAIVLLLQRRNVLHLESWSRGTAWLAIGGLLLVISAFLLRGFLADRPQDGFEPTHVERGQLVPGRFH